MSRILTVDFITFCHWRDWERLYAPDELRKRVESHRHEFNRIIVVHQRLWDVFQERQFTPNAADFTLPYPMTFVYSEQFPFILTDYNIAEDQPKADEMTHGPSAPHYWKWHVINHLIGLTVSDADYIVFSDCDCRIKESANDLSWVSAGITVLQKHSDVLMVSPSDGGDMAERRLPTNAGIVRLTQNVSQQLFLCDRRRFRTVNFDIPWDWEFTAPGGPFQEYYYMLEGRIWRYMHHGGLYRGILPDKWRYWHDQW